MMAAARLPARIDPANSQFFRLGIGAYKPLLAFDSATSGAITHRGRVAADVASAVNRDPARRCRL